MPCASARPRKPSRHGWKVAACGLGAARATGGALVSSGGFAPAHPPVARASDKGGGDGNPVQGDCLRLDRSRFSPMLPPRRLKRKGSL